MKLPSLKKILDRDLRGWALGGFVVIGLPTIFAVKSYHMKITKVERSAVDAIHEIAAGEDSALSNVEAARMARDLGYEGLLDTQLPISLETESSRFYLVNGEFRHPLGYDRLSEYLRTHSDSIPENLRPTIDDFLENYAPAPTETASNGF